MVFPEAVKAEAVIPPRELFIFNLIFSVDSKREDSDHRQSQIKRRFSESVDSRYE